MLKQLGFLESSPFTPFHCNVQKSYLPLFQTHNCGLSWQARCLTDLFCLCLAYQVTSPELLRIVYVF